MFHKIKQVAYHFWRFVITIVALFKANKMYFKSVGVPYFSSFISFEVDET